MFDKVWESRNISTYDVCGVSLRSQGHGTFIKLL